MKFVHSHLNLSDRIVTIWFMQPNPHGIKLKTIAEAWLKVTEVFTAASLVEFINKKMPGCAITEQEFQEMDPTKKKFLN